MLRSLKKHRGFSLIELAMVLIIVALLSTGLMLGISAQRNLTESADVQRQSENIREALLGFAMTNGRLPCPADRALASELGGNEDHVCVNSGCPIPTGATQADKTCASEFGVLPWKTLGISETDPWGNRFTYFVGLEFSKPFTWEENKTGMRARFTMDTKGRSNIEDGANHVIAGEIPAVIVSHGSRSAGAYLPTGGTPIPGAAGDEEENSNKTLTFISKTPNETFDDIVTWIVPSILKSRMVAVGRLP